MFSDHAIRFTNDKTDYKSIRKTQATYTCLFPSLESCQCLKIHMAVFFGLTDVFLQNSISFLAGFIVPSLHGPLYHVMFGISALPGISTDYKK